MKTKDVIISTAAIIVGVVVAVGVGVAVKKHINEQKIKFTVCSYDQSLASEPINKMVIGMLTVPSNNMSPVFASVIAVPPARDEFDAYLSAASIFENTNKSAGRTLLSFLPVYADGHIGDYIISSEFIKDESKNIKIENYMITDFEIFDYGDVPKKKKLKIIKEADKVNKQIMFNKFYCKSFFVVYDLFINGNNKSGDQRRVEKFLDQPINIYDIYNGWNLSKINKKYYNPTNRVKL